MNTDKTRKNRIATMLFAVIVMIAIIPFFCAHARSHAAAHNISEPETISITEKTTTVTGTTVIGNFNVDDFDYYKFTTPDVDGITYTFTSVNVENNNHTVSCILSDEQGEVVYSEENGINSSWAYEYGTASRKSTFKLKKNSTYYISVQAYPTQGEFDYKMTLKYSYDKPAKASIKSKKAKKKAFTVKIGAAKLATGYEIAYRVKGTSKWKTKKVSKKTVTIKKLKSKKTYQVRVRAIRKVAGKTLKGKWSKTKTIKVK
ncbi:MAG: fibronectin type III domain-containing protein [Eubacterium sp.]|nr:fibronectin type III domain-containing protein [Eubacterium sp.]